MAIDNEYWATKPGYEIFGEFMKRRRRYARYMLLTGRASRMLRAWSSFYGYGVDGKKSNAFITTSGQQGEIQQVAPPVYPTLVRQTLRLITGTKPAFKTKSTNSDVDAITESMMGDTLIDHYDTLLSVTEQEDQAVLSGLLLGSGYVILSWAPGKGEAAVFDPDTNAVVHAGDLTATNLTPWDVCYNPRTPENAREWFGFRTPMNRYNLAALARDAGKPELSEAILAASRLNSEKDDFETLVPIERRFPYEEDEALDDLVWVWELRHLPCPALPKGRLIRFIDSKTVLYDSMEKSVREEPQLDENGELLPEDLREYREPMVEDVGYPYADIGAYEFAPETVTGSSEPYSGHFDLLALQEAVENIATAAFTNINAGAVANFWLPNGAEPNVESIATGMNIITSAVKPEAFDLVRVSPEMMQFMNLLREFMQQAVGVSDTAMGEVKSGMPAQLAALLEAKALQFNAAGQKSYYKLVERVRTGMLLILKRFVDEPRVAELVGEANSWATKEWSNKDIANVQKVTVEPVNPQMKTLAGRMAIVDMLKDELPTDSKMKLLLTGSMDITMDGPKAREGRIAKEKALLRKGIGLPPIDAAKTEEATRMNGGAFTPVFAPTTDECVRPMSNDPHWLDIPEYQQVLESPESRSNGAVVTAVLDVIQEKLRLWRTMSPDMIFLLKGPAAPTSEMAMLGKAPGMPRGPNGAQRPQGGPSGGGPNPMEMPSPANKAQDAMQIRRPVELPRSPSNPSTGGQFGE